MAAKKSSRSAKATEKSAPKAKKPKVTTGSRKAPAGKQQSMATRRPKDGGVQQAELPGTARYGREPDAEPSPEAAKAPPDLTVSLEVQRRKPRLAWQGMDRHEAAPTVPTQVVEIVRPGLAQDRGEQRTMDVRRAAPRAELPPPQNRLIWTNDNLVALQTLLDERDEGGDWRYRGKVDLVYIDPPFMVNSDFNADNAIDIEIDGDEGVAVKKEPSLVEILAYKDTWRQGLDSFLTMLRSRLVLLKDLLAPTGSIYVHLDWHAVHYVKVLMDEVFGYENFQAEVVWKRASAHANASTSLARITDTILAYGLSDRSYRLQLFDPLSAELVRSHYSNVDPENGKRFALRDLTAAMARASQSQIYEWNGMRPKASRCWAYTRENMDRLHQLGRVHFEPGKMPRLKLHLDEAEGNPLSNLWSDIPPVNSQAAERLGYPTQKPVALIERIISASCPPGGLVLDCFVGSGTTAEAAERLGRRWIGIDNGKFGIHLARKRLIQLHGKPRPPEKAKYEYPECKDCGNIERKEKRQPSPGPFQVQAFTLENMGVYQRAESWQGFQKHRSEYRDAMVEVFGGRPSETHDLLHGLKGKRWVHVGPLDSPITPYQVHAIARAAAKTEIKSVDILSADFDTLSPSEREAIWKDLRVDVQVRIIPKSAIDEVRRRIELRRGGGDVVETTAIPAFYAPLSIVLGKPRVEGLKVGLTLERCEVDVESFLASQREPILGKFSEAKTAAAKKKQQALREKWEAREKVLQAWLDKADSWKKFVDFWAVDWDYQSRLDEDGKPIFETEWQDFRRRRGREIEEMTFETEVIYEQPGTYQIAVRVTDVFGNDGIATVEVRVG